MAKILIISDTHYLRRPDLRKFIESKNCDTTIHCGDIYPGYKRGDITNIYLCKGNNDYGDFPDHNDIEIDHIHFYTTHGHKGYAYNPSKFLTLDHIEDYHCICFGHTHIPYYYNDSKIMIINPGSVTLGRTFPRLNSYAIYDTDNHSVTFYNAKTDEEIEIKNSAL